MPLVRPLAFRLVTCKDGATTTDRRPKRCAAPNTKKRRTRMRHPKSAVALSLAGLLAATQASAEIRIGGAVCLTGVQAPPDEPGFKGAQVAIKQINDAGGLLGEEVRFLNIDGKSDPVTVGNAAVELIDQGAQLIVAPCDFDFGGPASREAQNAGIVGISMCASDPLYSSWSLGDKQFTLSMWNTTMGATAAEYAFNERGWKTAYVVTDQFIAYTKSLSKYFIEHFQALGGRFGSEIYFVTHTWMGPEAHPDMPAFIEAYTEMHGGPPETSFVATGYDTIMLMAKAVEIAGTTDGDAVAKALTSNEFDLLTGKLTYRSAEEGHAPDKAAVIIALTEGEPGFLGWRTPENPPAP